jgi:hypothetical protein
VDRPAHWPAVEDLRQDYYSPERIPIPPEIESRLCVEHFCDVEGLEVWTVDLWVWRLFDPDATLGGNEARHRYCPAGRIMLEDTGDLDDMVATAVHEVMERSAMMGGASYEEAHEAALRAESRYRLTADADRAGPW